MTNALLNKSSGIPLRYANRHGMITGQTGTGKTVSLMRLAESFSSQGVPVFVSDVKGDIGALTRSCPVILLDVFSETGQSLKTTLQSMGCDLLARAMELTDAQAGCLEIAFHAARAENMPLDTLEDLRVVLQTLPMIGARYGHVSTASTGVIMRAILRLESQGADKFFGNPQFDVAAFLKSGLVSILQADKLIQSPRVYGAFLLWALGELWQRLPEIGDCDKPRLVMFFDEAHLLFQDCPAALMRRIEQTVRLIRSKGVGVYFVSQAPDDIPPVIRAQLAHTIEHSRQLRNGQAVFVTMTAAGLPAKPETVQVDLPSCPLGALSTVELLPFVPLPDVSDARPPAETDLGLALIFCVVVAVLALTIAVIYFWDDGIGKALGAIAGLLLAFSLKK